MDGDDITRRALWWRVGPFGAVVLLALVVNLTSIHTARGGWSVAAAAALFVLVPTSIVFVPWERLGGMAPLVPVAGYCVGVALLRNSVGVGQTGYGPLVLLPIVWEALYGNRRELWCTVGLVAATLGTPILLVGGARYPAEQWHLALMFTATGAVVGTVIFRLVNERHSLVEQLRHQALEDDLTGLPNRRACEGLLEAVVGGDPAPSWLCFIDLDRFKAFNDAHGHSEGDDLLRTAAQRWQGVVGDRGTLGRWGGEEFLLLYAGSVHDVREVLAVMADATPAGQTFSAGVVPIGASPDGWARVLATADRALYEAKRRGRNRIEIVDPAPRTPPLPPAPEARPAPTRVTYSRLAELR